MKWTEGVGLALVNRDLSNMRVQAPNDNSLQYEILQLFPFTSESKRMGIIVRVGGILTKYNCWEFVRPHWH